MKSEIRYDPYRPLTRLEKGDIVYIRYTRAFYESEEDKLKYKNVPEGTHTGTYMGDDYIQCSEYPELSGKYDYQGGRRFGSSALLYADEKPIYNSRD